MPRKKKKKKKRKKKKRKKIIKKAVRIDPHDYEADVDALESEYSE
ncbi:MAG: hypothetical protein ACE5J4_03575 [Candidatus Aenigmatarchaeota archaeon]